MEVRVVGTARCAVRAPSGRKIPAALPPGTSQRDVPTNESQIDLAIFPDSINGSRRMAGVPEIQTERIYHECKFVFLSCAHVERGAVVHTTVAPLPNICFDLKLIFLGLRLEFALPR